MKRENLAREIYPDAPPEVAVRRLRSNFPPLRKKVPISSDETPCPVRKRKLPIPVRRAFPARQRRRFKPSKNRISCNTRNVIVAPL